jgi:hypothetical protein
MPVANYYSRLGRVAGVLVALGGAALLFWAWRAGVPWFERHVFPTYCATRPAHLQVIIVARIVAAVVGCVLIFLVAPHVMRLRTLPIVSVLVAIVCALAVTEITVRWLEARANRAHAAFRQDVPRLVSDPRLGWRYAPDQQFPATDGRRGFVYAIDRDGERAAEPEHAADPARPSIVIAGESIGFGHRLPYEETVAARLERDLGLQVVNLSVHGYDARQEYLRLRDALPRFAAPRLVLFFFVPQQIGRWRTHAPLRCWIFSPTSLITTTPSSSARVPYSSWRAPPPRLREQRSCSSSPTRSRAAWMPCHG